MKLSKTNHLKIVIFTAVKNRCVLHRRVFVMVFSQQIPMKLSALCKYFTNLSQSQENDMPEIQVTERGVLKLLQALNISKTAGPDGIRPRVLKELSSELAPIFTLLFQASIHQQSLQDIWKHQTCQCKPYLQERRQDKPIQLSACVLDLYFM